MATCLAAPDVSLFITDKVAVFVWGGGDSNKTPPPAPRPPLRVPVRPYFHRSNEGSLGSLDVTTPLHDVALHPEGELEGGSTPLLRSGAFVGMRFRDIIFIFFSCFCEILFLLECDTRFFVCIASTLIAKVKK